MINSKIKKSNYYKYIRAIYWTIRNKIMNFYYSIFGDRKYQKFVIIANARTGSNLLINYLDSHKKIEAKGELFGVLHNKSCMEIWNAFFLNKNKKVKFAGFKIFYAHPLDTKDKDVWKFISKDKRIKVIHLVRQNKLRTHVSRSIARKTNQWARKTKNKIPLEKKQIKIDYNNLYSNIKELTNYENKTRKDYQDHQFLEISYEDLVFDKNSTMCKVFDFLDVERNEFTTKYKQQNKEKLSDLILNYDEIEKKLKNSEFSYLLNFKNSA